MFFHKAYRLSICTIIIVHKYAMFAYIFGVYCAIWSECYCNYLSSYNWKFTCSLCLKTDFQPMMQANFYRLLGIKISFIFLWIHMAIYWVMLNRVVFRLNLTIMFTEIPTAQNMWTNDYHVEYKYELLCATYVNLPRFVNVLWPIVDTKSPCLSVHDRLIFNPLTDIV